MEMRLLLAFGLMGIVLFVTQYLMPKQAPKPPEKQQVAQTAQPAPAQKPVEPPAAAKTTAVLAKPGKTGRHQGCGSPCHRHW